MEQYKQYGLEFVKIFGTMMASMDEPQVLLVVCKELREQALEYNFTPGMFYLMKEALLFVLEEYNKAEYGNPTKITVNKIFKIIRNLIVGFDPDTRLDSGKRLNIEKKRIVEQSWRKLKRYPYEVAGPILYKHFFIIDPGFLSQFPF